MVFYREPKMYHNYIYRRQVEIQLIYNVLINTYTCSIIIMICSGTIMHLNSDVSIDRKKTVCFLFKLGQYTCNSITLYNIKNNFLGWCKTFDVHKGIAIAYFEHVEYKSKRRPMALRLLPMAKRVFERSIDQAENKFHWQRVNATQQFFSPGLLS